MKDHLFSFTVSNHDSLISSSRLDRILAQALQKENWAYQSQTQKPSVASTKKTKSLIEQGQVRVNQIQTFRASLKVKQGDLIEVKLDQHWCIASPHSNSPNLPKNKPLTPLEEHSLSLDSSSLEILYQDSTHLVVVKPSGLPTTPTRDPQRSSLYHYVLKSQWISSYDHAHKESNQILDAHQFSESDSLVLKSDSIEEMKSTLQKTQPPYVRALHRLDRPTSGLVLMSLDPTVNRYFDSLFQHHLIQKRYLALTHQRPLCFSQDDPPQSHLTTPQHWQEWIEFCSHSSLLELSPSSKWVEVHTEFTRCPSSPTSSKKKDKERWQVPSSLPKSTSLNQIPPPPPKSTSKTPLMAKSEFALLAHYQPSSGPPLWMIECRLHTGRTHQIRVHLSHLKAPIIGDELYGTSSPVSSSSVQHTLSNHHTRHPFFGLHARSLAYTHPQKELFLSHHAPLPHSWISYGS